jgi:hypothetical protein
MTTQAEERRRFEIFVNGTQKSWTEEKISYSQVVELAYPGQQNKLYTVTYSRGPQENREGKLVNGKSVYVKSGMVFDVTPTVQS